MNKRNFILGILSITVLLVVCLGAYCIYMQYGNGFIGTYSTSIGIESSDTTYIVFTSDGKYTLYKQFAIIASGEYIAESYEKITYIVCLEDDTPEIHFIFIDGMIYQIEDRTLVRFDRISSTPTYINIPA